MRYVLEISYNGTRYHGWQIQNNAHTIQAELNAALQTIFGHNVDTLASGRTDTGVHALQQFVQFDTSKEINKEKILYQLNGILPLDIYVKHLYSASPDFSVRHDALRRTYRYQISKTKDPFLENLCYIYFKGILNIDKMNEAAQMLQKYTDFRSFCKYHSDVNHFNCVIENAYWEEKDELLVFTITANRFLRGMVRAIVGTLLEVGLERLSIEEMDLIILAKDRKAAKESVPAQGLFLTTIYYEEGVLFKL